MEAGLPNITGRFSNYGLKPANNGGWVAEGCFYSGADSYLGTHVAAATNSYHAQLFELSAARSSSIYNDTDTVRPLSKSTLMLVKY